MSTSAFTTAIAQAHDLLRWHSPLRTELWAARLTASLEQDQVAAFLRELAEDSGAEARLTLVALAAVNPSPSPGGAAPSAEADESGVYARAAEGLVDTLSPWVSRMGRVTCEGAWYGNADPYGEQTLAVLSFRYENGKEPHILVVGIDQPNGGLAVDAVVEEPKFLDDLGLDAADPGVVGGRILDAIELGDRIMGAAVAVTLTEVRPLAIARARTVPGVVRGAGDDTASRFDDLPDLPGAREAFEKLVEFIGDRPLWWSPSRVSQFLTSWLPREAILSDEAVAAMPEVVRSWSRFAGDQPAVLRQIDEDAPRLPALMADDSLAGLAKRIAQSRRP
ncbi:hypothetical protein [Nonomuraea turcica]|uniref:hypothetical protein n=1 Tax=Nonomuraea sp. G32 TaxID=3067274 RepID=UPI00273C1727|nr:hypothetical protein [Nonomuraea sp. G32]MDP4502705.1 hypothetical protein [Nonomuraea sp. G32]